MKSYICVLIILSIALCVKGKCIYLGSLLKYFDILVFLQICFS